jgi:purine-cytosine permease-like protein
MAQDVARGEARFDAHSIEQIPEADRDSTGWQQFWIWAGANIAPINWILGALGIVLGLGLTETILVIVIGNLVGCAIFASLTVMGHKTGVNQMVLSRAPFGRRGGYLSSWLQFLMTMGWIGVNTYFPVILAVAILGHFGGERLVRRQVHRGHRHHDHPGRDRGVRLLPDPVVREVHRSRSSSGSWR